jgi:hypothetical protein
MANYAVQLRSTGKVITAYTADAPSHLDLYPYAEYNHIPQPEVADVVVREVSGIAFLRRFNLAQRIAIRELAATDQIANDFMELLNATIAQGVNVNLDDEDTIAGVGYIAANLPDKGISTAVILA